MRYAVLLASLNTAAFAQGNWSAIGQGATVRVAGEAIAVEYEIGSVAFNAAVLPVPDGLAGKGRLRFRLRTDHATAVGVMLNERKPGGGDYSAWFWSPANTSQQIELNASDFSLNEGPTDTPDPDGKLDLDQVTSVAILDLGHFFSKLPDHPATPLMIARSTGKHKMLIEGFELLPSKPAPKPAEDAIAIDAFDRGYIEWLTLGGMDLKLISGTLEVSYETKDGEFAVLVRRLAHLDLSKARRLAFDIASDEEATIAVGLELRKPGSNQGPRYNALLYPPGNHKVFHVDLKLDDFDPDPNSSVAGPAKPNASKLKSIAFTDISVATGSQPGPNKIRIGNLRALVK